MKWLIAVPVWGDAYRDTFARVALPSILAALGDRKARFVIATDRHLPQEMFGGNEVSHRCVTPLAKYEAFGLAHKSALLEAEHGEFVALLNADIIVSREVFAASEASFAAGKGAVVVAGMRTCATGGFPIGAKSVDLLSWAIEHNHQIVRECFWGQGKTRLPSNILFQDGEDIALHGFHLHPLAVKKDRNLIFGGTIDRDLLDNFTCDEIHVVTDKNEMAIAEVSPADKIFRLGKSPMTQDTVIKWARKRATKHHRWLFTKQIVIAGNPAPELGRDVVSGILAGI